MKKKKRGKADAQKIQNTSQPDHLNNFSIGTFKATAAYVDDSLEYNVPMSNASIMNGPSAIVPKVQQGLKKRVF